MSNYRTRSNRVVLSAVRALSHNGIDPVHKVSLSDIKLQLVFYIAEPYRSIALSKIKKLETLKEKSMK